MTSEKDHGPLSDTEGGEKPVREQLKKAHITSEAAKAAANAAHDPENGGNPASGEERGRLHRKRSHEEIEGDSQDATSKPPKQHTRKRSRDSTAEEEEINNGQRKVSGERARKGDELVPAEVPEANGAGRNERASTPEGKDEKGPEEAVESMTSPKTKRSRLHSTIADDKDLPEADKAAEAVEPQKEDQSAGERQQSTKIPPSSGFANASATSPFGALAGSKSPTSEQKQTSASAFASSGFGALAGSSTSGFGAIGKQSGGFGSGGSFASGAKSPLNSTKEDDKPSTASSSSFGGALGKQSAFSTSVASGSGFGSGPSGFGKLGSQSTGGFGSGLGGTGFSRLGGGGGLSSFASGKTASPLGGVSKSAKPFGAPPADDEEKGEDDDDDDKSGAKSPLATEQEKQDDRFYEQELETGEEDESTEFSTRGKLYIFHTDDEGKREWRERGLGVVRLNVRRLQPDEDQKPKARLLMRADGSHRVVLNTPVTKDIDYGAAKGEKPTGGYFHFMGTVDDKPKFEIMQLKVGDRQTQGYVAQLTFGQMKQANALELYDHISRLKADM
ncbi:hypothetical protein PRZ48_009479 [Zasmidium cellare]|uniref:RanBD1 domain-containing protein n=1 Tax=Zasmidium cellare TaxID=395010 RepID=A0ABR0ED19_ZASCE|nr:hypothetical protein PRZ48_009479 [Zasmidium cellare]